MGRFVSNLMKVTVLDYLLLVAFQALTIGIIFVLKLDTNRRLEQIDRVVNRYMQQPPIG